MSPHVLAAKIRTTPLGNAPQVPYPRLEGRQENLLLRRHLCPDKTTEERTAAGQETASTQAVKRGHQVAMIEVPDEEDDTAYQRWLAKGSPIVTLT